MASSSSSERSSISWSNGKKSVTAVRKYSTHLDLPDILPDKPKKNVHISIKKKKEVRAPFYVALLTECLQSLQIVGLISNQSKDYKHIVSMFKTLSDLIQSHYYDDQVKFYLDRLYVEDLIMVAIKDLITNENVNNFIRLVTKQLNQSRSQLLSIGSTATSKIRLGTLSSKYERARNEGKEELERYTDKLGIFKDQYEDILYENRIKLRYVNDWEESRLFQHKMKLAQTEQELQRNLEIVQENINNENFIHDQIVAFQTYKEAEYWAKIENWSKKFDDDLSEMITKITKATVQKENVEDQLQMLMEMYNSRQKEMNDYLILREKRREEAKLFQKRNICAMRIQAWWRGVMVRRCLGPYRKKKAKKGKNDKKKK